MKNSQIVVIAIFKCGGTTDLVNIEYIADEAYRLAPDRFRWKKFADRIDLRIVQDSLKDAKKEDPLKIVGSVRNGFQLTQSGLKWIRSLKGNDKVDFFDSKIGELDDYIKTERLKLKQTSAYKKIIGNANGNLNKRDYENFVKVNSYFSAELIATKIQKVMNIINGDEELEKVWANLKKYMES